MKLFVAIVITFAIASLSVAQPNLVGYWSGEVCEEFTVSGIPLSAHRTFEATADQYNLTLTLYSGQDCSGSVAAIMFAAGPYQFSGVSTAAGCTEGTTGDVYNVDLYTNVSKTFVYYESTFNFFMSKLCPWPNNQVPTQGQLYDIRNLNCSALSVVACEKQPQIVQTASNPTRLYFGTAVSNPSTACTEAARPTEVVPIAFILDLQTPNNSSMVCFAPPTATPVSTNVPIAVPLVQNINPVSAATTSQTRFIAVLGFFVALVLAML